MSTRRLIVMRHAKAEPDATTDHERLLTGRGTRDAERAGLYLAGIDMVPDHAVVSTAARAVGTWNAVAQGAGSTAGLTLDESVYLGAPQDVLKSLRSAPMDARVLIAIGHNPAVAHVAALLAGGEGDPAALREMALGYPTSAMAVFEVGDRWADLGAGTGRVTHFHVRRRVGT